MTALTVAPETLRDDADAQLVEAGQDRLKPWEAAALFRLDVYGEVDASEKSSPSDAVWTLACIFAQLTRDPAQLDRLMRSSSLINGDGSKLLANGTSVALKDQARKWDRPYPGHGTLGARTIARALQATEREYRKRQARAALDVTAAETEPLDVSVAELATNPALLQG